MRIALLGDIAFIGKMSMTTNPNLVECFSEVAEYLSKFDYVIGNLETPFSISRKTNGAKSAYICADKENVHILKRLHVNAVSLANNHMFDYGKEGYELTKRVLLNNNIEYFGTEGKEVFFEKNGSKIAISGFCCFTSNPLCCVNNGHYGVNAYNIEDVRKVVKKNHDNGYLNIVSVHAGLEHINYPSLEHVRAARLLADNSPYIYYGHHPHVIQGVEEYRGSIIAHSLGNFCFDDVYTDNSSTPLVTMTDNNRTGVILEIVVKDNRIDNWKESVIYISKDNHIKLLTEFTEIEKYNNSLLHCCDNEEDYKKYRNVILASRISERRSQRNILWYIKRLRLRYLKILLNARNNNKEYNKNVLKFIK